MKNQARFLCSVITATPLKSAKSKLGGLMAADHLVGRQATLLVPSSTLHWQTALV